jgi:TM2 domain-containing membrane protein YozV
MRGEADAKLFCDIAVDLGHITDEQANAVLEASRLDTAVGQSRPPGAYFFERGLMTREQIGQVLKMQERMARPGPIPQHAMAPHSSGGGPPMAHGAHVAAYPTGQPLSRVAYVLLGLFLGCLGVHNFAAGYTGRGLAQLLITFTLGWLFGLGIFITAIWAIIEIITVTRDGQGRPFT